MRISESTQPYFPSEAIPKSLGELTNHQWCVRHYAIHYLFDIFKQMSLQTTKYYSKENIIDMQEKVKHLLKETKKETDKAMQLESVQSLSNTG